jgi:hypothetical protein
MFGDPDGDAVEIWSTPTGLELLKVSYNLDTCGLPFIEGSINAAAQADCLFHSIESGNLLEASFASLAQEICALRPEKYTVSWLKTLNDSSPDSERPTPRG